MPLFRLMIGIVSLLTLSLHATPVSIDVADTVARNWMKERTGKTFRIKSSDKPLQKNLGIPSTPAPLYRIVQLEPTGWVIVSADDTVRPVLGYGESPINPLALPPAMKAWMQGVNRAITQAVKSTRLSASGSASSFPFAAEWHRLESNPMTDAATRPSQKLGAYAVVTPLLWMGGTTEESGIRWGQGADGVEYNAKCPADGSGPNNRAVTGCVATAIGQVMMYYKKPVQGKGSHGYTISKPKYQHNYGYQYADFSVAYDWDNMPHQLTATSTSPQIDAVSTLLYHIGVSVEMDYGNGSNDGGSLSLYHDPDGGADGMTALHDYFGFTVKWHSRDEEYRYDDDGWKQLLKTSLDNDNPILYGGIKTGGHAFVVDGYADNDAFHVNWGFDGIANGWYFIDHLAPDGTGYDFSNQQRVVIFNEASVSNNTNINSGTLGGGCTYNPHREGIDLMWVLIMLLAGAYPLTRRSFR